jgi:hypothetical protein
MQGSFLWHNQLVVGDMSVQKSRAAMMERRPRDQVARLFSRHVAHPRRHPLSVSLAPAPQSPLPALPCHPLWGEKNTLEWRCSFEKWSGLLATNSVLIKSKPCSTQTLSTILVRPSRLLAQSLMWQCASRTPRRADRTRYPLYVWICPSPVSFRVLRLCSMGACTPGCLAVCLAACLGPLAAYTR